MGIGLYSIAAKLSRLNKNELQKCLMSVTNQTKQAKRALDAEQRTLRYAQQELSDLSLKMRMNMSEQPDSSSLSTAMAQLRNDIYQQEMIVEKFKRIDERLGEQKDALEREVQAETKTYEELSKAKEQAIKEDCSFNTGNG